MNPSTSTTEPAFPGRLIPLLLALALATFGTGFAQMGFFFYATARWGWEPRNNLLLAAGQGMTYIFGALGAHAVAGKLGRKGSIIILPLVIAAMMVCCGAWTDKRMLVAGIMLTFPLLTGAYWPAMESLTAAGTGAEGMARRLAVYNLVWPAIGAGASAVSGVGIAHLPRGFFFVAAIFTALASVAVGVGGSQKIKEERGRRKDEKDAKLQAGSESSGSAKPQAISEPTLLRQRTLALWLSRIALPSTYVASGAISALMPTLPSLTRQPVSMQTAIGSLWLVGRFAAFGILAMSAFWHTRPRLLIAASAAMLAAFVVICVPASTVTATVLGGSTDLWTMGAAQMVLGAAVALIYSASLYFGMVLSDGATEHGGYHEALIGLGQVLGPGAAAAAQIVRPGSVFPAVIAVSGILLLSLAASEWAAKRAGRKTPAKTPAAEAASPQ